MPTTFNLAIEFFILFSKFECALKNEGYLRSQDGRAESNWFTFANHTGITLNNLRKNKDHSLVQSVNYLINTPPKEQLVRNGLLYWQPKRKPTNLAFFLAIARVRNNLFHGGKFGCSSFIDPERSHQLIACSIAVLTEFTNYLEMNLD